MKKEKIRKFTLPKFLVDFIAEIYHILFFFFIFSYSVYLFSIRLNKTINTKGRV